MGTTSVELVKKYHISSMVSCDIDERALEKARNLAIKKNVSSQLTFIKADARTLPFEDESFDVIINEAMLTMMTKEDKICILKEYERVLKPGGLLLTHDVLLRTEEVEQ